MKNPFVKDWLRRIREDLRVENSELLMQHVEQAGLELLLDPEFIEEARQADARQVVVLVATLGAANSDRPGQYQRLLMAYRCLLGQMDVAEAAQACAKAVSSQARFYEAVLAAVVNKSKTLSVSRIAATADDLLFGMKLLVDAQCSNHLMSLLKAWDTIDKSDKPWLVASRILVRRLSEQRSSAESAQLAKTLVELLARAPAKQTKVKTILLMHLCRVALRARMGDVALDAAKKLYSLSPGMEERFILTRALIMQGNHALAMEQADELLKDLAKNPVMFDIDESQTSSQTFNIGHAIDTLRTVNQALRSKNLQPFLMSGVLLGYERNRSLLPHDKDLDLGLIGWEHQFTVMQALLELGHFKVDMSELTGSKRYLLSAMDLRNGISVDFFMFHDRGDHYCHGIDFEYGYTENFRFSKFELHEVDFLGERFWVPSNIDQNLTENYGDWKTPEKNYVVTVESPAIMDKGGQVHKLTAQLELIKTISQRMPAVRAERILKYFQAQNIDVVSAPARQALEAWIEKGSVTKSKRLTDLLTRLKNTSKTPSSTDTPQGPTSKRKILLIGHSFGPDGAAMMLKKTARHWSKALGWRVDGYAPSMEHHRVMRECGIEPVQSWVEREYDLVLINSLLVGDTVFKLSADVPKVLWVHEGESVVRNSKTSVNQWIQMFEAYDGVIFQTRWQADNVYRSFIHRMPQSKIHVVPNGIDWPYPPRDSHARTRALGQPFKVVCVASMTGRKRPQDLAQAVMQLSKEMAIECTFIGDMSRLDTLPNEFQSLIHSGGHPCLKFLGSKSQTEIHQVLASSDAFCLPSEDESYPLSPLEAALTDVPVILADLAPYASIGWAHDDNSLIYKTGDIQALIQHIQALAGNSAMSQRLAQAARMLAQRMPFEVFSYNITQVLGLHMQTTPYEAAAFNA